MKPRRALQQLCLGMSVYDVSDAWRTDVYGALSTATPCVGLSADMFLREIESDVDKAFERWISKKKFQRIRVRKQVSMSARDRESPQDENGCCRNGWWFERDIEEQEDDQFDQLMTTELDTVLTLMLYRSLVSMTYIDDSDIPY